MKNSTLLKFFILLVLLPSSPALASTIWYEYNGHEYTLTSNWGTWEEAEAEALLYGGHLVTINDSSENAWLTSVFGGVYNRGGHDQTWQSHAWIGYYYNSESGTWLWASGEAVTYTNYAPSFPYGGGEFGYLHVSTHPQPGSWNANPVHISSYNAQPLGIIERPVSNPVPEPATTLLFSTGLAGFLWKRKKHYNQRRAGKL